VVNRPPIRVFDSGSLGRGGRTGSEAAHTFEVAWWSQGPEQSWRGRPGLCAPSAAGDFEPNDYQPIDYQPNDYQPNDYQPIDYQPIDYQPID